MGTHVDGVRKLAARSNAACIGFEAAMVPAGTKPPAGPDNDMADFTRIAESTTLDLALGDHAQTQPGSEIEKAEGAKPRCDAAHALGHGSSRRVIFNDHGHIERFLEHGNGIAFLPAMKRRLTRA